MSADAANWAYAEDFVPEDTVLLAARDAADQLGCVPVHPGAGRALHARGVAAVQRQLGGAVVDPVGGERVAQRSHHGRG